MLLKSKISTADYNSALNEKDREICTVLVGIIDSNLPESENKVWHGHPVWFLNGNPIVGYSKQKRGIVLLFWSGQDFEEVNLKPEGGFKAAEIVYSSSNQIDEVELKRWLAKSIKIQWDYKNIVKRKGVLEKIENEQ